MGMSHIMQLMYMLTEALFVGMVIVMMFSMRHKFGIAILYITLGTFQYLQTVLAAFLYFEIFPGVFVSPGSAVLFNASLFAVLLIYIKEDATEARKLIYGLMFANVSLTILLLMLALHFEGVPIEQLTNLPSQVVSFTPRVLVVGTLTLAADVLLIILTFEFIAKYIRSLFFRIYCAMAVVLLFDTLMFTIGSGILADQIDADILLVSSIIGKLLLAVVFSVILTIYIKHFEGNKHNDLIQASEIKDIFSFLTYRQKYEVLRREIFRDSLTGLYNRGFLNENLPRELERAKRNGASIAFLMLDIDNFKPINDIFGHQEGDRILSFLAMVIAKTIRDMDLACRYGGEEFSIILPQSSLQDAVGLAKRIQTNLIDLSVEHKPALVRDITLTIGIAIAPTEASTAEQLIALADKRLYLGKKSGKNSVVFNG